MYLLKKEGQSKRLRVLTNSLNDLTLASPTSFCAETKSSLSTLKSGANETRCPILLEENLTLVIQKRLNSEKEEQMIGILKDLTSLETVISTEHSTTDPALISPLYTL